jgi:hypothetical protein
MGGIDVYIACLILENMKDFGLESFKEFLSNWDDLHLSSWGGTNVETPFQIKPREFLRFAQRDLDSDYEHHLINALSNIKRAIDCQADSLLIGFGLCKAKRSKIDFPNKVALLNGLGIISPKILEKINKKRNLLEHEYANPDKDSVEDALDVATLFLAYTDRFLFNALKDCELENTETDEFFDIELDYKAGKLKLWRYHDKIKKDVGEESEEYLDYLKLFLSLYKLM